MVHLRNIHMHMAFACSVGLYRWNKKHKGGDSNDHIN